MPSLQFHYRQRSLIWLCYVFFSCTLPALCISWRIHNITRWTNFSNNGARNVGFGWSNGKDDSGFNVEDFVAISKIFATQNADSLWNEIIWQSIEEWTMLLFGWRTSEGGREEDEWWSGARSFVVSSLATGNGEAGQSANVQMRGGNTRTNWIGLRMMDDYKAGQWHLVVAIWTVCLHPPTGWRLWVVTDLMLILTRLGQARISKIESRIV